MASTTPPKPCHSLTLRKKRLSNSHRSQSLTWLVTLVNSWPRDLCSWPSWLRDSRWLRWLAPLTNSWKFQRVKFNSANQLPTFEFTAPVMAWLPTTRLPICHFFNRHFSGFLAEFCLIFVIEIQDFFYFWKMANIFCPYGTQLLFFFWIFDKFLMKTCQKSAEKVMNCRKTVIGIYV